MLPRTCRQGVGGELVSRWPSWRGADGIEESREDRDAARRQGEADSGDNRIALFR